MIIKAIIAVDDNTDSAQIVGWDDAQTDDLRTQVDDDMEEAGHKVTRYYALDIVVPSLARPTLMRLELMRLDAPAPQTASKESRGQTSKLPSTCTRP